MIRQFASRLAATLVVTALAGALVGCAHAETTQTYRRVTNASPALWSVADEDTTIYLFGTIHALPPDVRWFEGPVASALGTADTFVTELPMAAMTSEETRDTIAARSLLPKGESLRDKLTPEQRDRFEKALASIGLPPGAFDPFKPWFAGWQLSLIPLTLDGFDASNGVELTLDEQLASNVRRESLETLESQIDMFDSLSGPMQLDYLMSSAEGIDRLRPTLDAVLREWMKGNSGKVAKLLNANDAENPLTVRLLYDRNRQWAEWIKRRLETPGTVFMAVGAGHLAGRRSVQAELATRGINVKRVK